MDPRQEAAANPFGMDEDCRNCPALADCRDRIVHGYGDAGADVVVIGEAPSAGAERTGVPFTGDAAGERLQSILGDLGLSASPPDATEPTLEGVFLTHLTRCRHPERDPTDEEVLACEPFLNAEVRSINPELLVPVGDRALSALAVEYTTRAPDSFDVAAEHATTVRGRGFELLPMRPPGEQTDAQAAAFVDNAASVLGGDYRQTKGRRRR